MAIAVAIPQDIKIAPCVNDLSLLLRGRDIGLMEEKLQLSIQTVEQEAVMKGFPFFPEKTVAIHFCRLRKAHDEPQLKLLECRIPAKNEIKF